MMALARSALPRVSVCVAVAWSRHRFRNWGSTAAERALALPGDELIPDPAEVTTHALVRSSAKRPGLVGCEVLVPRAS
jgi:hypothetical protein